MPVGFGNVANTYRPPTNPNGGRTPPGMGSTIGPNGQAIFHGPQSSGYNPNVLGSAYNPQGTVSPGSTNRSAVAGATAFKNAMGLPDFQDLLSKLGGGTKEFGNSGLASSGAADMKAKLAAEEANLQSARNAINNPTGTTGFKDVMRTTNERLGTAAENDRRLAAEGASRRGYVGGYSPDAAAQKTREDEALAGGQAAADERKAGQDLFSGESNLYGNELGAYTSLTNTAAELPTKWLNSISGLLGAGGGFGDIFRTSSGNVQFDVGNQRQDAAHVRGRAEGLSDEARARGLAEGDRQRALANDEEERQYNALRSRR